MPRDNGRVYRQYRVLFLYPNIQMCALMPTGVALLSAMLRREGFVVDIFDCTFYKVPLTVNYPFYHSSLRPVNWDERDIKFYESDIVADFQKKVDEFQPDLIAVSVVENTYHIGMRLVKSLKKRIPTAWGGVFATFAPGKIIKEDVADYVCVGEGEEALLDLCTRLCRGLPVKDTPNFWMKADEQVYVNPMRPPLNLNDLPYPDFDVFEPQSIYRAMQGKVRRTIGIETQRGCPYTCAFCNSPSNNAIYKKDSAGAFYRKKSIDRVHNELNYLVNKYQPELIYFVVDTFLAMGDAEFSDLANMYLDFRVPFWMNTRCETITKDRAVWLERMNCMRLNMGIEHGNQVYREKVLNRRLTNQQMLDAFRTVAGRAYPTLSNTIISITL